MSHDHQSGSNHVNGTKPRTKWVFIGFAIIAAFLLITEHRAHLSGWLATYGIWLLLLACPLMHLFMHHGHGGGEKQSSSGTSQDETNEWRRRDY